MRVRHFLEEILKLCGTFLFFPLLKKLSPYKCKVNKVRRFGWSQNTELRSKTVDVRIIKRSAQMKAFERMIIGENSERKNLLR